MLTYKFVTPDNNEYEINVDKQKIFKNESSMLVEFYENELIDSSIQIPFLTNKVTVKYVENWINNNSDEVVTNYSILSDIIKLVDFLVLKFPVEIMNLKSILYNEYNIEYHVLNEKEYDECEKIKTEILDMLNKRDNTYKTFFDLSNQEIITDANNISHGDLNKMLDVFRKYQGKLQLHEIIDNCELISSGTLNTREQFPPPLFVTPVVLMGSMGPPGPQGPQGPQGPIHRDSSDYKSPCTSDYYKYKEYFCTLNHVDNFTDIEIPGRWIITVYKNTDYSILLNVDLNDKCDVKTKILSIMTNDNIMEKDVDRIIMYLKIIKSFENPLN